MNTTNLHKTAKEILHDKDEKNFDDLCYLIESQDIDYDPKKALMEAAHEMLQDGQNDKFDWLRYFALKYNIDVDRQMQMQRQLVNEKNRAYKELQGQMKPMHGRRN